MSANETEMISSTTMIRCQQCGQITNAKNEQAWKNLEAERDEALSREAAMRKAVEPLFSKHGPVIFSKGWQQAWAAAEAALATPSPTSTLVAALRLRVAELEAANAKRTPPARTFDGGRWEYRIEGGEVYSRRNHTDELWRHDPNTPEQILQAGFPETTAPAAKDSPK